ncbi:RNA-directed DNA polymerase [Desulfitobacterium sp.]|uniref:RNA-directed DNA polymerase n=1 Tax=Desulfitobacterium sp. TaxID=49981 RepID=UPI002B1FCD5E|nr:RNA-directed DNA polymerase [Desulfitobacterium sp.]MEA4900717.1 RNA-directed DNA polymerase [Desulfitobacterium sp.]
MITKLAGIAEVAKHKPKEKFTSLAHLINEDMLRQCHIEIDGRKAMGIDEVSKGIFNENLEENLKYLIERIKRHAYQPLPVRRAYIHKPGSDKKRPLGILAHEYSNLENYHT